MQPTSYRPRVSLAPQPAPWFQDASFRTAALTPEQRHFALGLVAVTDRPNGAGDDRVNGARRTW